MADTQLNNIPTLQNEEPQIRLLRARRHVFYRGKLLLSLQMFLTLAVPVIGSILTLIWPDKRGLVALVAIIITILDVSVFDRILKVVMKTAAKLQEQFDCTVLQLPWNSFATGARVEPETIHAEARKDDERQSLLNWYPPAVGRAPIHLGRIICQRTNLWYDSKLRRQYGNIALATGIFLCIILLWIGWYRNDTIDSFVLSFVAPASPIIVWCVREYLRQRDAADALDRLRNQA